jgi:hypothetical protein
MELSIKEQNIIVCVFSSSKALAPNPENGGIMLLESSSVPVQDEAYFENFWPSNLASNISLGYS